MICVICREQIDTSRDSFEEVGSIQFAHRECKEKAEDRERGESGTEMIL